MRDDERDEILKKISAFLKRPEIKPLKGDDLALRLTDDVVWPHVEIMRERFTLMAFDRGQLPS